MTGSVRSWIHYLVLRTEVGTQLEHRQVALAIKEVFKEEFPIVYAAAFPLKTKSEAGLWAWLKRAIFEGV